MQPKLHPIRPSGIQHCNISIQHRFLSLWKSQLLKIFCPTSKQKHRGLHLASCTWSSEGRWKGIYFNLLDKFRRQKAIFQIGTYFSRIKKLYCIHKNNKILGSSGKCFDKTLKNSFSNPSGTPKLNMQQKARWIFLGLFDVKMCLQ